MNDGQGGFCIDPNNLMTCGVNDVPVAQLILLHLEPVVPLIHFNMQVELRKKGICQGIPPRTATNILLRNQLNFIAV